MKKVLILNPYIPTLGGGEKHMGYLCQFMEGYFLDVKINILVFDYNDISIDDKSYVTIDKINKQFGLKLQKTELLKIDKKKFLNDHQFEVYLSNITKNYDLFINFMIFNRLIPYAKKNIYECMFPPKSFFSEYKNEKVISRIKAKIKDKKFLNAYDKIIPNSEYSNHWFKEFWGTDKKNTVIYPPVFHEYDLDHRYNEKMKKNIIISVGRFFVDAHSKKQLEMVSFFVKNQDRLKDYEYHLVGTVSNYPKDIEYLKQIKKIAENHSNIFIHENCKYEVLMNLYEKAKIFWHATGYGVDGDKEPEKMEHFGITTVEAMSFGVIPVVINKGGQRETVEEGINGYLWDTEEQCVERTAYLIQNEELRKEMAASAAKRARNFSIEEFYKKNVEVFDELHI